MNRLAVSLCLMWLGGSVEARAENAPPTVAPTATAVAAPSAPEKEKPEPFPLHASASLSHSVGSGTFIFGSGTNPTVGSLLVLNPTAKLGDYGLSLSQRMAIEYTQSDSTTTPNQVELFDPILSGSYNGFKFEDLGLGLSLSLTYSFPLSLPSRQSGSLGSIGGSTRASYSNEALGVGAFVGLSAGYTPIVPALAQRFANLPQRPFIDRTLGTITPVGCNPRKASELDNFVCLDGGLPSVARWSVALGGSYTFLDGALSASLSVSYFQGFSAFVGPDDEFTNENARVGLVPRQSTIGSGGLTWSPKELPWCELTGGIFSAQPALTLDGKGVRFPLWDFVSPYNNFSSIYVDTTFSI